MIRRTLQDQLERLATKQPVLTITGPRQSGKTTLARAVFPSHAYISLETPSQRELAREDPLAFLARFDGSGAILDEIQRAPELTSYLQAIVDEDRSPGRFVLTGSQSMALLAGVSQSLAGRTALLELLPLELTEIRRFPDAPTDLDTLLWMGGYPRIHDRGLQAGEWLADYTATYLERDVRSLLNVDNLASFHTFLRLCAGRVGALVNLASLAADCGIAQPTARSWISVLEASFILFRLPPFHANLGKRLTKHSKLYFHDTGLAANLIGIQSPDQMQSHPLRGALFENWVISEFQKMHRHRARRVELSFYRDRDRHEIDLLADRGGELTAIEIKAGSTPTSAYFKAFPHFAQLIASRGESHWTLKRQAVVYGGRESQRRSAGELLGWSEIASLLSPASAA
jgi:predicted AAA+ superfamily ATPase